MSRRYFEAEQSYYIAWITKFYNYYDKRIADVVSEDEINYYIKQLTNKHESLLKEGFEVQRNENVR